MTERSSRLTVGTGILLFALAPGLMLAQSEVAPEVLSQPPNSYPDLPSETPAKFEPVTGEFDHIRREVMISMRDGVRLFTVILVPKGVADAPILLTRTPYDADALRRHKKSAHLGPVLSGYDNAADLVVDGKMQIEALLSIVDCRDLIVWGTGEEELEAYRQTMGGRGLRIETTVDGDAIAATCNLIVTATPCHTPLLLAEQVRESTQITAMGQDTREKNELAPEILRMADLVVAESIERCRVRGEIFHALEAGLFEDGDILELGNIILDPESRRTSDSQITVADLTGVAVQDIQISKAVYQVLGSGPRTE